jgi:hypothetical protein
MVHAPKRSSVFGNRKTGDLTDREASRKAVGNQNLSPGRYDVNEEVEQATQKSLAKASKTKATPVEINPVVQNTVAQTYN